MTNLFYYKYDSETGELSRYNITDINENIYDSQNRTKITVSINGKDMVTYFDKRLIDHYKNDRVISYNDNVQDIIDIISRTMKDRVKRAEKELKKANKNLSVLKSKLMGE